MLKVFDSHTHVQFPNYDQDRKEVIERALKNGVGMINVGTDKKTSALAAEIAERYPKDPIYASVGLHPTDIKEGFDYEYYKKLAQKEKVVAVGECGLDYFRLENKNKEEEIKKQKELFIEQIKLATDLSLPLMVHCRPSAGSEDAYEDLYKIIKPFADKISNVVIHFFIGSAETAKKFLELGFYFTFGGVITFTKDYDETIKRVPLEKILTETDAPFVAPQSQRGKRNEPSFITEVVEKLAEIKNISPKEMANYSWQNAQKAFNLTLPPRFFR